MRNIQKNKIQDVEPYRNSITPLEFSNLLWHVLRIFRAIAAERLMENEPGIPESSSEWFGESLVEIVQIYIDIAMCYTKFVLSEPTYYEQHKSVLEQQQLTKKAIENILGFLKNIGTFVTKNQYLPSIVQITYPRSGDAFNDEDLHLSQNIFLPERVYWAPPLKLILFSSIFGGIASAGEATLVIATATEKASLLLLLGCGCGSAVVCTMIGFIVAYLWFRQKRNMKSQLLSAEDLNIAKSFCHRNM